MEKFHNPVLLNEVIEALQVGKRAHLKSLFIDATVGLGGHAAEIVKMGGRVLGIDADPEALKFAEKKLKQVRLRSDLIRTTARQACPTSDINRGGFKLIHGNFKDVEKIATENGFDKVAGILFDLGVSSPQLTSSLRGFSFQNESAPLDMRMDKENQKVTAADLLNALDKTKLASMFGVVLPFGKAKRLSTLTISQRRVKKIETVGDFLEIVDRIRKGKSKLHPATLSFMALRIAVNSELENLKEALPKALRLLAKGGRLVVISFHSGEDVIVKKFFKTVELEGRGKLINKKLIVPSDGEIKNNPRARSAKMRVLEKI